MTEIEATSKTVSLRDITEDVASWDPSSCKEFTYVDISAIDNQRFEIVDPRRIAGKDAPSRARRPIQARDVLFSNVRTYLRNVALVGDLAGPAVASTGFTVLRPTADVDERYLFHLARSDYFISRVTPAQTGTHYPATSDRVVRDQTVELPSKDVQLALVRQIDDVDGRLRSAHQHIQSAHQRVELLRRTILMLACLGRLTADWREDNPGVQSVEDALGEVVGKKRRSKAVAAPLDLPLPELPDSYLIATVGQAATILEYGTSKKCGDDAKGVPVLRMGNITDDGLLKVDDLKYAPKDAELKRLALEDGDLLFNRTNSAEKVGKTAVFHEPQEMSFASYLIRVRLAPDVADPDFVNLWLNSAWGRLWARHVKTDGVSQSNINGTKLGNMPLPLPPIEEQREIVARASALLKIADELSERTDRATAALERSAQAVLAKAFRGELSPAIDPS